MSKTILHLSVADKSYVITNEKNQIVSLDEAKRLWKTGEVWDCNVALQRLATTENWDIEALKRFYAKNPR